ncbi:DUF7666 domain-containing protein [Haemophilus influenzae]|uniref:DUF7666 domain-containing protein n=2 Tax=Haemophilus influenzae TaxID=727 RepID=UPI0006666A5A|nr:hypothetical protein [Haemophilus influenzae]PRJ05954.1 hypothetical protein BV038_01193 [Haemophilus influenzae]PRJ52340.1 hypothetical protein BV093_00493 [Haemophilus influenzae]PRK33079.1 hypothetical protein BV198_00401 [Haemophilus influenzae]PRK88213.1 hypothetical protein BV145_00190 [Haemophilus influenzae]PRK91373.1 hypothetical protein BV144_00439 [Haemophilus influenzae]
MTEENKEIIAYKGFNQDWTCRGYQYEIGKTYEHKGDVKACESGFHACEYPLDVLSYYSPAVSKFAVVKMSGETSKDSDDTKIASAKITIETEINLPEMIKKAVEWIKGKVDWDAAKVSNTGYRSVATNTGDQSAATNTGDWSAATNTGYRSVATNTGYRSVATNTGDQSAATNTGYWSAATNTGDRSAATNTGYWSAATNTGYRSAATNTGDQSVAEVSGKQSIAVALGWQSKAKASINGAIVCVYRNHDGELIHIKASKVGENNIKADTWYTLDEFGEFVEVKDD